MVEIKGTGKHADWTLAVVPEAWAAKAKRIDARVYRFAHYDSRGGDMLIKADKATTAMRRYDEEFGNADEPLDVAFEDLQEGGKYTLLWLDEPNVGNQQELHWQYAEEDDSGGRWAFGVVKEHPGLMVAWLVSPPEDACDTDWEPTPPEGVENLEMGEDACGVIWLE